MRIAAWSIVVLAQLAVVGITTTASAQRGRTFDPVKDWHVGNRQKLQPQPTYRKEAEADLQTLAQNPALRDIKTENWHLTERSKTPQQIALLSRFLVTPLPGEQPLLAFFLDPILFSGPIKDMRLAWSDRSEPLEFPNHTIEAFLERFSGKTIILLSHIEKGEFVLGESRLSVRSVLELGRSYRVSIIPIGCKTALAGAPFGFQENISTDDAIAVLRSLPLRPRFAELFAAMSQIKSIEIDIPDTLDMISATVYNSDGPVINLEIQKNRSTSDVLITGSPRSAVTKEPDSVITMGLDILKSLTTNTFFYKTLFTSSATSAFSWLAAFGLRWIKHHTWLVRRRSRLKWLVAVRVLEKAAFWIARLTFVVSAFLVLPLLPSLLIQYPWMILIAIPLLLLAAAFQRIRHPRKTNRRFHRKYSERQILRKGRWPIKT